MPLPTHFISHGGGPWPWVPNMAAEFAPLEASYRKLAESLQQKPKAVLMISGHWETESFAVQHCKRPPMVYDYGGFPPETYEVSYPAPGAPELAEDVAQRLHRAGLPTRLDDTQGYDHGTFVPMSVLFPEADVPLFQVSLQHGYDPAIHWEMGRALAPLRDDGILIIGSGLSYHNLRLFGPEAREPSEGFDQWLQQALQLPPEARRKAILNWEQAPYARVSHKKEDHLAPLFVILGASERDKAEVTYHQKMIFGGVTASSFQFG